MFTPNLFILKLSIITVNLNNATGLHKTIKSVVSQTSHNFEYIIIDGGSTDGSVELIQSFTSIPACTYTPITNNSGSKLRDPCTMPLTYWLTEPDTGIYQAMNKGIRIAKGEYCQFLNSGDWLAAPDVIEKMVASLPDCSIYYGNMIKQIPKRGIYRDTCGQGNVTMLKLYNGSLNHSPDFIKRNLFEKYGLYDENLRIASDWKWFLIVIGLHNESVEYINLDVSCFDMNGISNKNPVLLKRERRKVLEELLPANILADYDAYCLPIDQVSRLNRYKITRWLSWFLERVLFKLEKWEIL